MGVASPPSHVTLDNPPANSYDLDVMRRVRGATSTRRSRPTRASSIVRSASEKFFSAGADVKKFLAGDVEANMEMIRTSQAALHADGRRRAGVHRVRQRPRAGRRAGDRAGVRRPAGGARLRTSWARRRSRSGCCPATAARSGSRACSAPRARWTCCSPAAPSGPTRRWRGASSARSSTRTGRASMPSGWRPGRSSRSRRSSAACTRAASFHWRPGSPSRRSWSSGCSAPRTRTRASSRSSRSASRSSGMSIATTYAGAFVDGAEHRNGGDPLPVTNPADGQVFAEVAGGTAADVDAAVASAQRALPRMVRAGGLQARRDPRQGRPPRRAAPRRARPPAHPRAGQDAARLADRDHEGRRHADALRRPLEGAARRAHAEPRPRRRGLRAAPPAGRGRRDRAVELPHHAALATSSPRRSWPATRWWPSRPARRR